MNALRRHKHAILLVALLSVIIVRSLGPTRVGTVLSELIIMMTMLLVFLIVFERRADRLAAFIAFVTAATTLVVHYILSPSYPQSHLLLIHHSALLLLTGFATFVILRNIFAQRVVGTDDVLGAVCGYLLAGGAWSGLFLLIETLLPGSFSMGSGFHTGLDTWEGRIAALSYVSLSSLTSVGSDSIVPVRPPATILIPLEALFGQFYIAVVVAQLVGARLSQSPQHTIAPDTSELRASGRPLSDRLQTQGVSAGPRRRGRRL